jgi:multidrug efflux pump subunit AcrB
MNIAEYAIKKSTNTWMLIIIVTVGGLLAYRDMARLEDPVFTIKDAKVYTAYAGASPEEVELEVSDRIEQAVRQMPQVKEIQSVSSRGLSEITVTMKDVYNAAKLPQVWDELRRKVGDVQKNLPPGVSPSVVNDDFGDVYGMLYAVTGDGYSYHELKDYVDELKKHLTTVTGVAKVSLAGEHREVIYVEISRTKAASLGMSPHEIFRTLQQQNVVVNAGGVRVGDEFITISPSGAFSSVEMVENLVIPGRGGDRIITLRDIATVTRGYEAVPSHLVRHDGKPAIMVGISALPGTNVVAVGQAVDSAIAEFEAFTPVGMVAHPVFEQPKIVEKAVAGFILSVAEALAIVFIVLVIFMGVRSAALVGVVLLLNVIGTMIFMGILDMDLQRISLGALIIALGMLVDNAIVVTDGILVRMQGGEKHLDASKAVVGQTMIPLLGATIVGVMAFAGIGLSPDKSGEYCKSLFQVILISLMFSWILAVMVVPLLSKYFLKGGEPSTEEKPPGKLTRGFESFLRLAIRQRMITMVALVVMLVGAVFGFSKVKQGFFPDSSTPILFVHMWLPQGTDIRATDERLMKLSALAQEHERVEQVTGFVGRGAHRFTLTYTPESPNSSYGMLLVRVNGPGDLGPMMEWLKTTVDEQFPDVSAGIRRVGLGPTNNYRIEARFSGPDPEVLRGLSEQAKAIFSADPDAVTVRDDWREPVKILRPQYSDVAARRTGVSRAELANALAGGFEGATVGAFREGDRLLPIISRPTAGERGDAGSVDQIQVWSSTRGQTIPINQVVSSFDTTWEDALIYRRDRKRTITAQANGWGGTDMDVQKRVHDKVEAIPLPTGYKMEWGGDFKSSADASAALMGSLPLTFLIMIVIVVLLFGEWRQPLLIWLIVPLALIGVVIGLLVTDKAFDFMALLGFLSLTGMMIKNAIVLVDQIDLEIREGKQPLQAVVDSALSRARPVLMAAATTVLGVVPLLPDAFFVSMSVLIMAGLTFATVLTLIVVPVLYTILFKIPATE